MDEREEWIAKRAYELWEEAGRPDDRGEQHWSHATSEWEQRQPGATASSAWDDEEQW